MATPDKSGSALSRRAAVLESAKAIDEVAQGAMALFHQAGSFEKELALAQAMQDLRTMLTPEVMAPIMSLMNSRLGFLTDRDPKRPARGEPPAEPYPAEVVRDCVIEARLRGFHTVGNEFNIISGSFYAAKAGFRRKLTDGKTFPGLSGFKDHYDAPRNVADKGALVRCRAEWTMNGQAHSVEVEIPVKVNSFMGADGILGKAERKLLKRVHDLLAGMSTPDAEPGETVDVQAREAPVEPRMTNEGGDDEIPMGPAAAPSSRPPPPPPPPPGVALDGGEADPKARLIVAQLGRSGLTAADAMRTVQRMFPETSSCENLSIVAQHFPNVMNALTRDWQNFRRAVIADAEKSEAKAKASAAPAPAPSDTRTPEQIELDAEAEGTAGAKPGTLEPPAGK